ncbi:MAG: hypothetical protein KatS3mg111_3732 [Pirellulaceae bacterium]|nr:MAG: hypothetical protein KatS3mg111_3732 [Pirellulaceae bacterium]
MSWSVIRLTYGAMFNWPRIGCSWWRLVFCWGAIAWATGASPIDAQQIPPRGGTALEAELRSQSADELYDRSLVQGNAARGAILFHGALLGCGKCHAVTDTGLESIGPNLAAPRPQETPQQLVQSLLDPSARIEERYRTVQVLTADGQIWRGILQTPATASILVLRTLDTQEEQTIDREEIVDLRYSDKSVMPDGLVRSLSTRQEFYDLIKYLVEIRDGGAKRARELQPTSAQLAIELPSYEADIDHAGFIRDWGPEARQRGEKIYHSLCINCHGTLTQRGSLDTALRFAEGKFKYGADPYSMYQTLTRGGGLMLPQPWMVPQQKYDVIHYIREVFLREHNRSQYFEITDEYLASLPKGSQRGPAPQPYRPWAEADYGPRLVGTYEIGSEGHRNIAHKGIAVQLDEQPGGIAHGRAWAIFEHDTMRLAAVWVGTGFIDWHGIHFDGRHGTHPRIVGKVLLANPTAPGWGDPRTGKLEDEVRVVGRDGRRYGPLPRQWAQFEGWYQQGHDTILAYRVGQTPIRETYRWSDTADQSTPLDRGFFVRLLQLGKRPVPLRLVAATLEEKEGVWHVDRLRAASMKTGHPAAATGTALSFDGGRYYETSDTGTVDVYSGSFTIAAKVRVRGDGTIFARAPSEGAWAPGGQSLFVRGGRLCYDVGWVGVVQSDRRIDDGQWHRVAVRWDAAERQTTLWVDGRLVGSRKELHPPDLLEDACFRLGMTSPNFPATSLLQDGQMEWVRVYRSALPAAAMADPEHAADPCVAYWRATDADSQGVVEAISGALARLVLTGGASSGSLMIGVQGSEDVRWSVEGRKLVLELPAGEEPLHLAVWSARATTADQQATIDALASRPWCDRSLFDVEDLQDAAAVFAQTIVTAARLGTDQNGFAVDELTVPEVNPWRARFRAGGHDFFADGDRAAVCTWDGDVWIVSGLSQLEAAERTPQLVWRRFAFGLFQPLGLRIVDDAIYVTCRDQLLKLEDRNGDGEADFYRCINNDHQVTEHFHEFALGLQTDAEGNFYYAKSARHALPAVVPQHGTLLKVRRDGSQTEIVATGFRAANGVCLNADGTFVVTDQEGHWNPKNRINWVHRGGFYGNMFGYHDVTDPADDAMEQPLCWITNSFDRSPAELLWVDSPHWGPLHGSLLNLSYGYGRLYVVPHEQVAGQMQGGMCPLPIADFPTGIIRGRFAPFDGQLYVSGLSAWATSQMMKEGGFYRIRYTGRPVGLPVGLAAHRWGMEITFSEPLAADTPTDPRRFHIEAWDLQRTANYGSKHYNQREWSVDRVELSDDRRVLRLVVPQIAPTWGMEIRLPVKLASGVQVERVIHNTIHRLQP